MKPEKDTDHGLLMEVLDAASSPLVCGKENPADALCAVLRGRGLHVRRLVWIPEHQSTFELNCGHVADLVVGDSIAVFVDGCYWHGCPVHGTRARNNAAWWSAKIATNQQRDADTSAQLEALGWALAVSRTDHLSTESSWIKKPQAEVPGITRLEHGTL